MGFLDSLNHFWSSLDWWDKQENANQKQQFAQDEEKKRRQRQVQTPGTVFKPSIPDPVDIIKNTGLQSQLKSGNLSKPQTPEDRAAAAAKTAQEEADKLKNRSFLDRIRQDVVPSFFKTLADTPKTLELSAKRVGTGTVQGAGGTVDLLTPGKGQNRVTQWANRKAESLDTQAKKQGVEDLYKRFNVPLEIGSYAIPTKAISKLPLASKLIKAGDKLAESTADSGKLVKYAGEAGQEFLRPENLVQDVRLTSRYLGQESARGKEVTPREVAENAGLSLVGGFGIPMLGRTLRKVTQFVKGGASEEVSQGVKQASSEAPEVPRAPKDVSTPNKPAVQISEGVKSTNLVKAANQPPTEGVPAGAGVPEAQPTVPAPARNVPEPTDAGALVKAPEAAPIANFGDSVKVPPSKIVTPESALTQAQPTKSDIAEQVAKGDLRLSTATDAQGNPVLQSDTQAAREAVDQGVVPERGPSQVQVEEAARAKAAEEATNPDISRARQKIADSLDDPALKEDILTNFQNPDKINIDQVRTAAKQNLADLSDAEIVDAYRTGTVIDSPQGYFEAIGAVRRLQRDASPEAQQAVSNILNAIDSYKGKGGQTLRVLRTLYEDMPTPMKQKYLIDKVERAIGASMQDADRNMLASLIERADTATEQLRTLEDEAAKVMESLNNKSVSKDTLGRSEQLLGEITDAVRQQEVYQNDAWRFYEEQLPKGDIGRRAGDVGRTLMLSAPSGRIFDFISTFSSSLDKVINKGVSNLIGKGVNLVKAPGTVASTLPSPRQLIKGTLEGAKNVKASFGGKDRTEDFIKEVNRNVRTRGEINAGGGAVRRFVRNLVNAPTELSRGIRNDELFRQGMQEAAQQGLKGDAQKAYAGLRAVVPEQKQLDKAIEEHLQVNMLHENGISRTLNSFARILDDKLKGIGGPTIRNQVAPFTSWLGGNFHRTLTDKNVLYNAAKIIDSAFIKKDLQAVIDHTSNLLVNTGEVYAVGMLLSRAGVLTNHDANGDDYAGLYFHIGDRYIPVAITGTISVPLILGNAIQQGMDGVENGDNIFSSMSNALANGLYAIGKNAGIASVFGGENNLQQTVSQLFSSYSSADGIERLNPLLKYAGNVVRQYIPGLTGDINALLDQTGLNPSGEAPQTKLTYTNPETGRDKTDVLGTELAKTEARIPFLSQGLPREVGTPAKDLLDRAIKSNRATGEMEQKRAEEENKQVTSEDLVRTKVSLEDQGYPVSASGASDAFDEGKYDWLAQYTKYEMNKNANDGKLTESERKDYEKDIKKYEFYRDGNYTSGMITAYEKSSSSDGGIGVTAWRNMIENGNKQQMNYAKKLQEIDEKLFNEGIIDDRKYYWLENGKKVYKGSGHGGKGSKPRLLTSIATQDFSGGNFKPIKAEKATFAPPQSAIPELKRVPNYDTSRLRKISVKKGVV